MRRPTTIVLLVTMLLAAAPAARAGEWRFGAELYGWLAGLEGATVAGDRIDVSFSDLAPDLELGFLGVLAARKDRWLLFVDVAYLKLGEETESTANIIGLPVSTRVDTTLESFIATAAVGYSVKNTGDTTLDLLAGVRYLDLDLDLDFDVGSLGGRVSLEDDVVDAVIGLRGKSSFGGKWYLTYYLDAGTGDSDLTWQASLGVNYKLAKVDLELGYRYLEWQFEDEVVLDDLALTGPYVGVRIPF